MTRTAEKLQGFGYETEQPQSTQGSSVTRRSLLDAHFAKIDESDAILVVNATQENETTHIGASTLMEIAHAYSQGLEVFVLNSITESDYSDEVNAVSPIVLNGDLKTLDTYISELPTVYVSSTSPVKHRALSRGLRRAGIRAQIKGVEVPSGVEEQPMSIEESYEGATNRHQNMVALLGHVTTGYMATIESGLHMAHPDHNYFGCNVVVLQKVGEERHIGVNMDIEFPRSMTDKIPSEYADIGVLVQQVYGSKLKDAYPFLTGGKLTRAKILENSVYNLATQMENA